MRKNPEENISYPNLGKYREEFISKGVNYPLKSLARSKKGLLSELPSTDKSGWPWNIEVPSDSYSSNIKWPKITILTPSYNQGAYIEETIRSVLLQNYPNLEYIIMDGGSTDGTKDILEKYSPWISFWESETDRGQGHAINKGFALASGDIYGWINSDDFYLDQAFLKVSSLFKEGDFNFLYGDGLQLNEENKTLIYEKGNLVANRYLFLGGVILQHSSFWSSGIHLPILEVLHCAVDSELWFRLIPKAKTKHIKSPLAVSRVQPNAKTVNLKYVKMWKEDNALIERIHEFDKTFFFKYVKSRFYSLEARYVQRLYKHFNKGDEFRFKKKLNYK
ncbi:glycosyltransferase involved in cell wall biosynthesis [Flavobacterium sp. W4I14]|nr:glycosyltransferase involved in cell wall biosynthesis [Flavobacterium sp. W4I14]